MSRTLPLFPLRLVLFPEAIVPLHIFEPRYRQMLHDCLATDKRFGLLLAPGPGGDLEPGTVGCIARVDESESLPDGRSNILIVGEQRFTLDRLLALDTPYLVGDVTLVDDVPEARVVNVELAESVRVLFERAARAARLLSRESLPLPTLVEAPEQLAFQIAQYVDFDLDDRQFLLASRSPRQRLERVHALLAAALPGLEARADVHRRARSNGHGPDHG